MSLGAAFGGFAQGLAGGLKLRSDLDDAETRRGLVGTQQKLADLQVSAEQEKQNAATFAKGVTEGYYGGNAELGFVRNEDGTYDAQNPTNVNRYYDLSRQASARFAAAHGQDPNAAIARVDEMQNKKYAEGVSRAAAAYGMGDLSAGDAYMRSVSALSGITKKFLGTEADPADPNKVRIKYAGDDGKEQVSNAIPLNELANRWIPFALDPTAASNRQLALEKMTQENKTANRQLDIIDAHYTRADANESQKNLITASHYKDWFNVQKEHVKNEAARTGLLSDQVGLQKVEAATGAALNQISTLVGFNPKFDASKASPTEILQNQIAGDKLQSAAFLQQQGGFDKNGFKLSSGEAANVVQQAYAAENLVNAKQTKNGMYYVQVGDTAVPVLGFNESKRAALQKELGIKPARSASGAIRTPPEPVKLDSDGTPIPRAGIAVPSGYGVPDARGLLQTPSYSAGMTGFNPD